MDGSDHIDASLRTGFIYVRQGSTCVHHSPKLSTRSHTKGHHRRTPSSGQRWLYQDHGRLCALGISIFNFLNLCLDAQGKDGWTLLPFN